MRMFFNEKFSAVAVIAVGVVIAGFITNANALSQGSASISLEKDKISGFFNLSIRASAGIKEFVIYPAGKSSYGGGLGGCPPTFKSTNVVFGDPGDFTPKMGATVTDCNDNAIDFDLLPPKNGLSVGTRVLPPPVATPASAPSEAAAPTTSPTKPEPKSELLKGVQFPVTELGSCSSEVECVSYCDDAAHAQACVEFAKKNKIITNEEAAQREKLADVTSGPGGCTSQKSCESYCSDLSRLDECFSFAEKHSLLSEGELGKIGKLKTAIKAGATLPGGCNNQRSCETYCNDVAHSDECLAFGEKSGFLDAKEIEQYRKFSELHKSGETPGKCSSRESCEAYCSGPDNAEECIAFAEKAGFLSGDELTQAKKMMPLIKEGKTPGKCSTKEQCEAYCGDESHMDECTAFGLEAGMLSPQDAEMIKKTGGKGPGGCHSKEQCQTYCEEHQDECMGWAKEHGLENELGGEGGGAGFSGPGGCKSREECTAYCTANQEDAACQKMMQDFGGGPSGAGFSGPGGCKSREECTAYCQSHQEECQNFSQGGGRQDRPDGQGQGGNSDDSKSGFTACVPKGAHAEYVCGINGKHSRPGMETTYFNECHAKQTDVQILHAGVCIRNGQPDKPCSDIADPVCGNDNNTWVSACYAEEAGGGVQYTGVCKGQSGGGGRTTPRPTSERGDNQKQSQQQYKQRYQENQAPANYGGPGGCKSQEECTAYCTKNPDKCQGAPSSGDASTDTGVDFQYKGQDPGAECAKYGGTWDGKTCQKSSQSPPPTQNTSEASPQTPPPAPPTTSQQQSQTPSGGYPSSDYQKTPQDYCSSFASVQSCSYVGAPDSQNYKYCKQCYPDK